MKLTKTFALVFGTLFALQGAQASTFDVAAIAETLATTSVAPLDLINWKVGDNMLHNVKLGAFGNVGTSVKTVTSDEGAAIWVKQELNLMVQKEVVEVLINKADAKILKMIRNGQEMQVPDGKLEVISQEATSVTVPAGKFDCIHVVAKSAESQNIQVWINPRDTAMDGALKQVVGTQFGEITMELTSFKKN